MKTIIESYRAGLFKTQNWLPNIISGIIVGVVAVPLAMAFAMASGAEPEQGLYTSIVAGFLVAVFGGSRVQIAGPTGAFIIILAGITKQYGIDGLQVATIIAGFMLIFMGMIRLGGVIKFIPDPVIVGFTAGIAVVIFIGQWTNFFGLPEASGIYFHEKLWHLSQSMHRLDWITTAFGVGSLLILVLCNKIPEFKRIPGPLVVLIVGTSIQSFWQFDSVATVGSVYGGIPQGLPEFHIPMVTWKRFTELLAPALSIAMLGSIESLLSAVVADSMAGTRHHSNRELVGQGIANVVAPFFGGFAATGAIARTATNIRNGGNSPLSGIVHSVTLILILLFLAPYATNIPLSVLSAILFVVAWNMSEAKHVIRLLRSSLGFDVVVLLVTFFLTIFVDLIFAVEIGVVLAIIHFLYGMVNSIEVQQQTHIEISEEFPDLKLDQLKQDVMVYAVQGPFFFGAVELFERALAYTNTEPRVLIIRLLWVPFMDSTAIKVLKSVIIDLQKRGVKVMLTNAAPSVKRKLRQAGVMTLLGEKRYFNQFVNAIRQAQGQSAYEEEDEDAVF